MENSVNLKENLLDDCEKGFTEAENVNILNTDQSLGSSEYVDEVNNLENTESVEEAEAIIRKLFKRLRRVENLARRIMMLKRKRREEIKDLQRRGWNHVVVHYLCTLVFAWSLSIIKYDCDVKSSYLVLVISAEMMNLSVIVLSWRCLNMFFAILLSHVDDQVKFDIERGVVTKVDKMHLVIHRAQLCLVTFVTCAAILYEAYLGVVAYNCGQVPSWMTLPFKVFQ